MRSTIFGWRTRARRAEARVAALECEATSRAAQEEEANEHVSSMVAEADAQANAFYEALEQIRDADHGHPRNAAGAKFPSGRCPICCIIAEVGV